MTSQEPRTLAEIGRQDQLEAEFDRNIFRPLALTGDGIREERLDAGEIRLSKSDAEHYTVDGSMRAFLACLARWAERMTAAGYTIVAEPLEGPGTMRWRAVQR